MPIVGGGRAGSMHVQSRLHSGLARRRYTVHMSSNIPEIPEEFKALSTDERIAYVQALWDFIAQSPDEVPMPDWHKEILEERLAARKNRPKATATWEEVRERVLGKSESR